MARFLFATMPVPGHVAPIAPVVRTLVDRGHQVTWYTSAFFADKVATSGAEFSPIRSTFDFGDADYDRHYPDRLKYEGLQKLIFDFEHVFVGSIEGYVTDLRALMESNQPDALVVDPAVAAGMGDLRDRWPADGHHQRHRAVVGRSRRRTVRARPAAEQFADRPGAQQGALRAGGPGDLRQGESRLPATGPKARLAGVSLPTTRHSLVVPAAIGAGTGVPAGRTPPATALHRPAVAGAA